MQRRGRTMAEHVNRWVAGQPMSEILAQNRRVDCGRWPEFAGCINGRESAFLRRVDAFDIRLAPRLDRVLDALGLGFIITVHARKPPSWMYDQRHSNWRRLAPGLLIFLSQTSARRRPHTAIC